MDYRLLGNTEMRVSALSFGASSLGSMFRKIDEDEGIRTVHTAFDLGINYYDCSPFYGITTAETLLGKALKKLPRDQYYLATKCGRYGDEKKDFDYSYDRIIRSADESMQRLGVDYLDVLQLHDIEYYGRPTIEQALSEGIPALQKLKEQGKIRFYGFGAYPVELFIEAAGRVDYDTVLCHNHYSLNDTQLLDLLPLVEKKGLALINASPLASGLLTKRGVPDWHPATKAELAIIQKAVEFCESTGTSLEKVAMQFSTCNKDIPTTLVSTASSKNIIGNVKWVEEPIDWPIAHRIQQIISPLFNKAWSFVQCPDEPLPSAVIKDHTIPSANSTKSTLNLVD